LSSFHLLDVSRSADRRREPARYGAGLPGRSIYTGRAAQAEQDAHRAALRALLFGNFVSGDSLAARFRRGA